MKQKLFLTFILVTFVTFAAVAQRITGVVTDSKTGEALPFANVSIEGGSYTRTNEAGRYALPFKAGKMRVSMIGYATKTLKVQQAGVYNVKLDDNSAKFGTAVVTGHKTKYTRKNNPAVELMRKVIEAKKMSDLKLHDYYSIHKYSKLTFAFNDVTDKIFEEGKFKKMPFLKDLSLIHISEPTRH